MQLVNNFRIVRRTPSKSRGCARARNANERQRSDRRTTHETLQHKPLRMQRYPAQAHPRPNKNVCYQPVANAKARQTALPTYALVQARQETSGASILVAQNRRSGAAFDKREQQFTLRQQRRSRTLENTRMHSAKRNSCQSKNCHVIFQRASPCFNGLSAALRCLSWRSVWRLGSVRMSARGTACAGWAQNARAPRGTPAAPAA